MILIGLAGSVLGAYLVARSIADRDRQEYKANAHQVASVLRLAIQHEEDLSVSAGALFAGSPDTSNTQYQDWAQHMRAFERYPEVTGLGFLAFVPSADVDRFVARAKADPAGPIGPKGSFEITPAGTRPFYCLLAAYVSRPNTPKAPANVDRCASKQLGGKTVLAARDSGESVYLPTKIGTATMLVIRTPTYRNGTVPTTVAERRRSLIGWTGTAILPKLVLDKALEGHPKTAVVMRYRNRLSNVSFSSGKPQADGESTTIPISDGWTVHVTGPKISTGLLAARESALLLIGGIVLSGLLGLLVFILGTSRSRALKLVTEKTGELNYLALHDALTGLPNRALVMDRAAQMLARAERQPNGVAALFIDVDGFKQVNDNFGHAAGDEVLKIVGERLLNVIRDSDTVGRLGGDEFVVLLESASAEAPPQLVAERLIEVLHQPIEINAEGKTVRVSASIGIAVGRRGTADELLRDADLALYAAKEAGKDRYIVFDNKMKIDANDRSELKFDLVEAIDLEQFFLVYQPTFDLQNKRVMGVEALLRWNHPKRGIIAPDDFIPLAEETGLIVPIGQWVLDQACEQAAEWHRAGHKIGMSVNVSAVQLDKDALEDEVQTALANSGLDPKYLTLEITETALMRNIAAATDLLNRLKKLGVRLAIDDFGTGYSSLAYLRQFPIDALKIDRSFISGVAADGQSTAIIHTLVQLGKALNIETLAEGIEDQSQLDQLEGEQIDHGQGFLFAEPLDAGAIEAFLNQSAPPPTFPPSSMHSRR